MNAIRVYKTIDSETLHLPELKPFVGKRVEIVVLESVPAATEKEWEEFFEKYGLDPIDPEIYKRQREYDRLHANDHIV